MAYRIKMAKDIRPLVRAAEAAGWKITTNGKHVKLTAPDGSWATPIPSANRSWNLLKEFKGHMRKHGVTV